MGSADRRGIGGPANRGVRTGESPCHPTVRLTPPYRAVRPQWLSFLPNCGNPDSPPRYGVATFGMRH